MRIYDEAGEENLTVYLISAEERGEVRALVIGVVTRGQARRILELENERLEEVNEEETPEELEDRLGTDEGDCREVARETQPVEDTEILLLINEEDKKEVLRSFHDSPFGGHFGVNKTYEKVKSRYRWEGMKKDIENYVKVCKKCQLNKGSKLTKKPLVLTGVSVRPWERLYIDIVEGPPESNAENNVILSMIDDLTKFVMFEALVDQKAHSVAKAIFENIMCRYTIPKQILSDRGTNFRSDLVKELCKILKIKKLLTSPYRPSTNNVVVSPKI